MKKSLLFLLLLFLAAFSGCDAQKTLVDDEIDLAAAVASVAV